MKYPNTMKNIKIAALFMAVALQACQQKSPQNPEKEQPQAMTKAEYQEFVRQHQFSQPLHLTPEEIKAMPKADRPDLAWQQNFMQTLDPAVQRPTPEVLIPTMRKLAAMNHRKGKTPGDSTFPWVERGPENTAGRVRAMIFDPNDSTHKRVFSGGVTGGLWVNDNIHDPQKRWKPVNNFWSNLAVTAITYDPTNPQIMYAGTGEGWGVAFSGQQGAGVWKSTNGGSSWSQLPATSNFEFVNDMVVRDENGTGVLYVGVDISNEQGLQRSADGGTTFSKVVTNPIADLEIGPDNKLWVGTIDRRNGTGGGGNILFSRSGSTFINSFSSNFDRVKLATAPSDSNYVYAIIENGGRVNRIIMSNNAGNNWTVRNRPNDADPGIPASDFSRGQAWYDLSLAVDPNDPHTIIAGAVDLFISTDSAGTWKQLAHWFGGFGFPEVHADQHEIRYSPGSSDTVIFATDGGIHYSNNVLANRPGFNSRNLNFNITQFYSGALHPASGGNYMLGGTQDNGTRKLRFPGLTSGSEATGGDGGFCFIDQNEPNIQITSFTRNSYNLSINSGLNFNSMQRANSGRFINPADYDDNQNILYSALNFRSNNRILNVGNGEQTGNFSARGMRNTASHFRVSPYHPNGSVVFVGTGGGGILRYDDAHTSNPVETNLTTSNLPNGSVSCIEIGATDNELLAVFSNFGIPSVWYSNDGGTTWQNKEGNLPNMPIRWALFNPNDRKEVLLATELGIWSTKDIQAGSPVWEASTTGMANVRVDMLQLRQSDNMVQAATHGRGMFQSDGFAQTKAAPVADFMAHDSTLCDPILGLYDRSSNVANSWNWSISPSTFQYVRNTDATSRNPQIEFTQSGTYTISLTVTNAFGSDTETKQSFISAGEEIKPTIGTGGIGSLFTTPAGFQYQWYRNGSPIAGDTNDVIFLQQPGNYFVEIIDGPCSGFSDTLNITNIGIDELETLSQIKTYPNPVDDALTIEFAEEQNNTPVSISILSLSGKKVFEKTYEVIDRKEILLSLPNIPQGIYILHIENNNQHFRSKIEKL